MADKYLKHDGSGNVQQVTVITTSAGAGDSGKLIGLDANGKLDSSFMPAGIGADTASITASENLAAGDMVNIHISTGIKVRKADASAIGTKANGFVLAAVTSGNAGTVYFRGSNDQVSGLTAGTEYFLSETAGAITATPPTTSTAIVQRVGNAVQATELMVDIYPPIILA